MMAGSPQVPLGLSDQLGARVSLGDCLETALNQASGLMGKVMQPESVKKKLNSNNASHGENGAGIAMILELLSARMDSVRENFAAHLRKAVYEGVGVDAYSRQLMRFEDLQLLEEEQLDESIEQARAQQEIEQAVEAVLPQLDALMSTLLGWIRVQPQINPLRPAIFVRALCDCLADHIPDPQVRGAVVAPIAARMGLHLARLYKELADWLRSNGVEPAGLSSPPPPGTPVGQNATASMGSSVARTLLTLDKLRRLLSGELDAGPTQQDFGMTVPASVVALQDMRQVEAMVQRLSKRAKEAKAGDATQESLKQAAARMALADGKSLGKQLGEEVVRLMLENLLQDERLLARVRGVLASLEPVMLRLAKSDQQFFSNKAHPARKLIERITSRSLGYSSEQDEGFARFIQSIESATVALNTRTTQASDTASAFSQVMVKLDALWAKDDEALRIKREEAARALMQAEQRNMLAQYLAQDFRERAGSKDIPQSVLDFACGPWAQVVAQSQLAGKDGTSDPLGYSAMVDELFWSVQPRVARRNRTHLVEIIPGILGKLRQGLQLVEFPPERIAAFFDELIGLHEAALEGRKTHAIDIPAQEAANPDVWLRAKETQDAGYVTEDSVMPTEYADSGGQSALGSLPVNAWVELVINGAWLRVQLNWVSPHRSLYMFVSASGSTHSMSQRTLDKLREAGSIRMVSDGHMVENALDAVAQTALRNSLGSGSTKQSSGKP